MDGVAFGEADGVRLLEAVDVGEEGGEEGRGCGVAEEEGCFGVFNLEGFALLELAL